MCIRDSGEAELTFVPKKKEQKKKKKQVSFDDEDAGDESDKPDNGRSKPRFEGRRASKNVFRGM